MAMRSRIDAVLAGNAVSCVRCNNADAVTVLSAHAVAQGTRRFFCYASRQ
jgi:DNA-binding LacI/PurR family transcriptional regulator